MDARLWVMCLLAGLSPLGKTDELKSAPRTATADAKPVADTTARAAHNTTAASTAKAPAASAAAAKAAAVPEADDDLLEFLGSVDSATGDDDWLEYLSQADIAKAAKARTTEPAAPEVKKND